MKFHDSDNLTIITTFFVNKKFNVVPIPLNKWAISCLQAFVPSGILIVTSCSNIKSFYCLKSLLAFYLPNLG